MGDVLVVAVNSDRSVRRHKGSHRPIINQQDRAALLSALGPVDHVLIFDADTPHDLLRRIRPDVLVKGGTYTTDQVVGREIVGSQNGQECATVRTESDSISGILACIHGEIASRDGGHQGVGFAIPINLAKWVSAQLREHGHVRRGYLGVTTTARSSNARGLRRDVVAARLHEDSPAYKAGVREHDIIVSFDNRTVRGISELREIVEQVEVGSKHQLAIIRGQTRMTLAVVIEAASSRPRASLPGQKDLSGASALVYSHDLELAVSDLGEGNASQLGLRTPAGVLIVRLDPGGAASKAGVREGMVIVRVGNHVVNNTEDFAEVMERQSLRKGISLEVYSRQGTRTISVRGS